MSWHHLVLSSRLITLFTGYAGYNVYEAHPPRQRSACRRELYLFLSGLGRSVLQTAQNLVLLYGVKFQFSYRFYGSKKGNTFFHRLGKLSSPISFLKFSEDHHETFVQFARIPVFCSTVFRSLCKVFFLRLKNFYLRFQNRILEESCVFSLLRIPNCSLSNAICFPCTSAEKCSLPSFPRRSGNAVNGFIIFASIFLGV